MKYELFYLIGASKEVDLEKIKSETEKIVTDNGGNFSEKMTIEKRRLSYMVKHETHGIYIARRFDLEESENLKEINAKLNLNNGVLRFIISRADDLPELKSKEERMKEVSQKETLPEVKKEVKKEFSKESKKEKIEEVKEKETKKEEKSDDAVIEEAKQAEGNQEEISQKKEDDDIDKKLEEILNI